MIKNLKRYIYTSLISSILFVIIGIILIIFPETSLNVLRWLIVVLLMLSLCFRFAKILILS